MRERKRGKAGILVPLGVGRGGEFKEGFSAIGVNEAADKTKRVRTKEKRIKESIQDRCS